MCGLVVTTDGLVFGTAEWSRALQSIADRGPDAVGQCTVSGIAFGHQRLSIIGLGSAGEQPMMTESDDVLVFNGEIYNYQDLARDLGIAARSDTQVLYEIARRGLWSTWVRRLRGMYAFVHYNRTARELTVGRDPFGIKPLFLRQHPNGELSLASTVAALVEIAPTTVSPSPVAISGFLANGVFSAGTSAFAEISKIEAGSLQTWTKGVEGWTATSIEAESHAWPTMNVSGALRDSVAAHLVADVEVAVLMSGGVDSTLVAAIAAGIAPEVRTFCLTNPDDPSIDEAVLARHNADLLGTTHLEVPVGPTSLANRASALIRSSGEPFSDAAYLPLSVLAETVGKHVKVALAGEGADELFGGYRRYDLERWFDARGLGSAIRAIGRFGGFDGRWPHPQSQRERALHASALTSPSDRHAVLMFAEWTAIRRHFHSGDESYASFQRRWEGCAEMPWAPNLPPNRSYDLHEWLPNVFLEKSDRASMLHGLEVRTPFLDPVVARAAAEYRPRNSRKEVLRAELRRLLPGVALPKRKKGLSVNTAELVTVHYDDLIRRTVLDPDSVLNAVGLRDQIGFLSALASSPGLAFRVAMLGIWQELWL